MCFRVRWTEPSGPNSEEFDTPKAAMLRYVEVRDSGCVGIEIRDASGKKLSANDLAELVAFGKGDH
jgi:hypothetical protein